MVPMIKCSDIGIAAADPIHSMNMYAAPRYCVSVNNCMSLGIVLHMCPCAVIVDDS